MSLFSGHQLTCRRGDMTIMSGLDFSLAAGQLMILRGANGSGKTSCLRLMAGLIRPVSGHLSWTGPGEFPEQVHWIGPTATLKPDLTIHENLAFWSRAYRGAPGAMQNALAAVRLDLPTDLPVRTLSGGQRQRLHLSRLLLSPRLLWLLDEPETGLDEDGLTLLRGLVSAHIKQGGAAVIATHRADLWTADQTIILEGAA